MFKQDLSPSQWSVSPLSEVPAAAKGSNPAQIPGCIHLDLIRAGLLKHPREGFAELDQFWVGKTDWRYECRFEADDANFVHECIDLVCEGLDTIATIELNGKVIGSAANMFHPHRFRLGDLKRGENHLAITFTSPLRHVREEEARLGARPVNGDWDPYIFIRKAAVNFGWDFAPKVPTCGIWKPIRLEAWSGVRIAGVRPRTRRLDDRRWSVTLSVDLDWQDAADTRAELIIALEDRHNIHAIAETHTVSGTPTAVIECRDIVDQPDLWNPNGLGDPVLYHLTVTARIPSVPGGIDQWQGRIGFREVRLNTEPDEHGTKFQFEINRKPIFCKGANWVPDSLFPTEVTRERYRERVKQAADANMNMLRVWGGGYYESEDFYQACDELGILVWQDFMFACAMYPEEAPFPALVEAEARHQITRLSSHASVALWCGGNECVWAYESWGNAPGETAWKQRLGDKTWGRGYYFDLLPRLVAELDPTRPYWANSPWSGSEAVETNGQNHGDRHTWDVRVEEYRNIVPRFCSEFGLQSPSDFETLKAVISTTELRLCSRSLEHRERATGGIAKHIGTFLAEYFPPRQHPLGWHVDAQRLQALALKLGIEWMRVQRPRCMGSLMWQFNEVWPSLSWSIVDSDGEYKEGWSGVETAFRPRLLTIQPVDGMPVLFAVNDLDQPWRDTATVRRRDHQDSGDLVTAQVEVNVPGESVVALGLLDTFIGAPRDVSREWASATCTHCDASWFYGGLKALTHRP